MNNHTKIAAFCLLITLFTCYHIFSPSAQKHLAAPSENVNFPEEGFYDGIPNLKEFHLEHGHMLQAIEQISNRSQSQGLAQEIEWLEKGPVNIVGRTRVVLIDKRDTSENTVFAAGVSGGLWKTTNFLAPRRFDPELGISIAGVVWEPVPFDFPNLGICALVQDPNNLDVFYAGTGEFWTGSGVVGAGIWKSTDGGDQWEHLSATRSTSFSYVNRLIFDQEGKLYAATGGGGLQKSIDGGASWSAVLDNASGTISNIAADIDMAANGDLYVSFGGRSEYGHIYKSGAGPNVGNAGNWNRISLPDTLQRKEIACAPSDASKVYVLGAESSVMTGFFISEDGGNSWVSKTPFKDNRDEQANYNMALEVSKDDPDFVMAGGITMFKSFDAGSNWVRVQSVHADNHFVEFLEPDPDFDKRAIVATDGGMWTVWEKAANPNLSNISARNDFYRTTQFYGIAVHPDIGASEIIGGTQDNGTLFFDEPDVEYVPISNGDGGFPYIDENEPHLRILNAKQNTYIVNTAGEGSNPGENRTILIDGDAAFINSSDYDDVDNVLYASTFKEAGFLRIKNVFQDPPTIEYVGINGFTFFSSSSVDVSPNDHKKLYLGSSGKLYRIDNAQDGSSVDADLILDIDNLGLRNVAIEEGNEDHVLASFLTTQVDKEYLWETKNSTAATPQWESFHGDLPKIPVFWVIFLPNNNDQAMVGTEFGIWMTEDIDGANTHWEQCKNGVPNVRVTHLVHRKSDDRIVAASYGRGIFYTQAFENTNAFFTNRSTQIKEEDIFDEALCRSSIDLDIPVEISRLPEEETTIEVSINMGETTASLGNDFEILSPDQFIFGPGSELRQNFTIRIFDDNVLEENEQIAFQISSNEPGINISQSDFLIELADNEQAIVESETSTIIWEESWESRFFFMTPSSPWRHSPDIRELINNRTSQNIWRVGEICNPINLFTAAIWYNDGPTFINSCGYLPDLNAESIMYREVDASGIKDIQVAFDWTAGGISGEDYGTVVYSLTNDPFNWQELPGEYVGQSVVLTANISLPSTLDDQKFYLGWRWINDANGTDQMLEAMSIDNIVVSGTVALSKAEIEDATVSQYIGQNEDVVFFSDRNRLIANLQGTSGEELGCTTVSLEAKTGIVQLDTLAYSGFYLPYSYTIQSDNSPSQAHEISLFFDPDSINEFLIDVGIPEDSLAIYLIGEERSSLFSPLESIQLSDLAASKEISFMSASNGTYVLGWIQRNCTVISTQIDQSICFGESFEGYNESGTFTDSFIAANGCDSTRTLNLVVNSLLATSISQSICAGESFEGYSETGTFTDTFIASNGCDSTRTLNLIVNSLLETSITQRICAGESFEGYSETGTYTDTFTSVSGCDSTRTLNLTVAPLIEINISQSICAGESFEGYTETGVYTDTFTAAGGCDSTRTLNLVVNQLLETNISQSICAGEIFEGYSETGVYTDTFTDARGCDSTRTLNLTVRPTAGREISTTICSGESFEGYSQTGVYEDMFTGANGCDSTRTLNLTVIPPIDVAVSASICLGESFEGYTRSGFYRDTLLSVDGCDSIRRLSLSVLPTVTSWIFDTICFGESFEGYTASGQYRDTLVSNQYGCDSIRTLSLTVRLPIETNLNQSICSGESFEGYTETGIYTDSFTAVSGCDSMRTLNLTVLDATESSISESICAGESFEGYTETGIFTDTFTGANGCDSTRVLDLTVLPDSSSECVSTSISPDLEETVISLYPNPGQQQIQLFWTGNVAAIRFEVFQVNGGKKLEGSIKKGERIDIRDLAEGLYWLRCFDGKEVQMLKFVKL